LNILFMPVSAFSLFCGIFIQPKQQPQMLDQIEVTGNKDTRSGFGDGILEAARINSRLVGFTADRAGLVIKQRVW